MWEIYAYQNVASLTGLFNAVAGISGSASFHGALAMVGFFGFTAAVLAYAFAPQKLDGWQWLASVTLIMSCLFVPRATVAIVDKSGADAPQVIDNVPLGLAVLAGSASAAGNAITELFETAFQSIPVPGADLPAELSYQRNGLMFGSRLVAHAEDVVVRNPDFRNDTIQFLRNCVAPDLATHYIDANAFATSTNVWQSMADTNPARFSSYFGGTSQVVAPCTDVYAYLSTQIPGQAHDLLEQLTGRLHPTLSLTAAMAAIDAETVAAFGRTKLAQASMSAQDIIIQGAMLNMVRDHGLLAGAFANDPAATALAVGQSTALTQTNAAWINGAKVAEQALPVVRNVIEALVYALFPLVVLLMLLSGAKSALISFKNYAAILIWIQLWPPLYAVLNYMATLYAQWDLASAGHIVGNAYGLTLTNQQIVNSAALSGQAVVAYLTLGIPMLAWAALKRMENVGSLMAGGVGALQSAVTSTTSAAAAGNVSLGQTSVAQVNVSPSVTSGYFSRAQNDVSGETSTARADGGLTAISTLRNSGAGSVRHEIAHNANTAREAREQAVAADGIRNSAAENFAKSLSSMVTYQRQHGWKIDNASSDQSTDSAAWETSMNHLRGVTTTVAKAANVSEETAGQIALGLSVAGNKYGGAASAAEKEAVDRAKRVLTSDDLARVKKTAAALVHQASELKSSGRGSSELQQHAGAVSNAWSGVQAAEASYQHAVQFAQSEAELVSRGVSATYVTSDDPHQQALFRSINPLEGGGEAQQTTIMLANALANRGVAPAVLQRDFNVPKSLEDVRAVADAQRAKPDYHVAPGPVDDPGEAHQPRPFDDSPTKAHPAPFAVPRPGHGALPGGAPQLPGSAERDKEIEQAEKEVNQAGADIKERKDVHFLAAPWARDVVGAATENFVVKDVLRPVLNAAVKHAAEAFKHPIDNAIALPGAAQEQAAMFKDNVVDTAGSLYEAARDALAPVQPGQPPSSAGAVVAGGAAKAAVVAGGGVARALSGMAEASEEAVSALVPMPGAPAPPKGKGDGKGSSGPAAGAGGQAGAGGPSERPGGGHASDAP